MNLYMPADALDALIDATGFGASFEAGGDYDYKYRWLLERIGMMKQDRDAAAIVHDHPEIADLVAVIKTERAWSAGLSQTIQTLQAELERLRRDKK